jgi:hypothetical protein
MIQLLHFLHKSRNIDYFRDKYLGGVTGFTKKQFFKINGYSNSFYGWLVLCVVYTSFNKSTWLKYKSD